MARKGHTEAQIGLALRQAEAGTAMSSLRQISGTAVATFYHWNQRYAGMGVAEIRRAQIGGYVITCNRVRGLKASP